MSIAGSVRFEQEFTRTAKASTISPEKKSRLGLYGRALGDIKVSADGPFGFRSARPSAARENGVSSLRVRLPYTRTCRAGLLAICADEPTVLIVAHGAEKDDIWPSRHPKHGMHAIRFNGLRPPGVSDEHLADWPPLEARAAYKFATAKGHTPAAADAAALAACAALAAGALTMRVNEQAAAAGDAYMAVCCGEAPQGEEAAALAASLASECVARGISLMAAIFGARVLAKRLGEGDTEEVALELGEHAAEAMQAELNAGRGPAAAAAAALLGVGIVYNTSDVTHFLVPVGAKDLDDMKGSISLSLSVSL